MNKEDLIEGAYYYTENGIERAHYCEVNGVNELITPKAEVLAPVPSYDEWKALNKGYDSAVDANLKQATWMVGMEKENKRLKHDVGNLGYRIKNQRHEIDNRLKKIEKLKELLKDAKNVLKMVDTYYGNYDSINGFLIVKRIDEVLK